MNFFVASDGNWMVDGTVETYDGLQLIKNLIDYAPSVPASNYHTVYYWGGKGGSFRNGWTDQIQALAQSLGYTFRKQETGDLNISDVRVMFWPALGSGDISVAASDAEINAMKNLLAEGGRIIITTEYDNSDSTNDWVNVQFGRLGSSIKMLYGGSPVNTTFSPEPCDAFSHDINSVMFRAYGFLESTSPDAVVLYYGSLGEKIFIGEIL